MVGAAIAAVGVALAHDALVAAYEMVKEIDCTIATSKLKPFSPTKKSEKPCAEAWSGEKDVQRGRRLTKSQAINQVRLGQSVMCDRKSDAREADHGAFQYFLEEKNSFIQANHYYYKHFHEAQRVRGTLIHAQNGAHVWFLFN